MWIQRFNSLLFGDIGSRFYGVAWGRMADVTWNQHCRCSAPGFVSRGVGRRVGIPAGLGVGSRVLHPPLQGPPPPQRPRPSMQPGSCDRLWSKLLELDFMSKLSIAPSVFISLIKNSVCALGGSEKKQPAEMRFEELACCHSQ